MAGYIVLKGSGESATYSRHPFWFDTQLSTTGIKMTWQLVQNTLRPRAKLVIDFTSVDAFGAPVGGTEVTDWTPPNPIITTQAEWNFTFDAPNGHHIVGVRTESGTGAMVIPQPFLVNATGARLPDEMQRPWTAIRRFETAVYQKAKVTIAQVQWRPDMKAPFHPPLLPRDYQPFSDYQDPRQSLQVRRLTTHVGASFIRDFVVVPPYWDIAIECGQKYFYNDTTSQSGFAVGTVPPRLLLRDGPHGVNAYGQVYEMILRDKAAGGGIYTFDPSGRVAFQSDSGTRNVRTLYGWRVKPGVLPVHSSFKKDIDPIGTPEYDARYEFVGDTSQLPEATKRPHEPWSAVVWEYVPELVSPANPLGLNLHSGHEILWTDTLNHQILFLDHWTAHSAANFAPASYPPVGYVQASAPTGQTTAAVWGGHPEGLAQVSEFFNNPWGVTVRLPEGKVYWTNFEGNNICRANIDGSNKEKFLQCSINPANAQIYVNSRLGNLKAPPGKVRGWVLSNAPTDLTAVSAGTLKINSVDIPGVPAAATVLERTAALLAAINSTPAARVKAILYSDKTRYYLKRTDLTDRTIVVVSSSSAKTGVTSQTAYSHLIDGPIGHATCVRPQALKTHSNGDLTWTERYTHALRAFDFQRQVVVTIAEYASDLAEGDHLDGQLGIDRNGTNGPVDDAWINCWKGLAHRIAKDGTKRRQRGTAGTLRQGVYEWVDTPGYNWAVDVHEGREVGIGSAGGSQFVEYTRRILGDKELVTRAENDHLIEVFNSGDFLITHGAGAWEGSVLGCPTPEELVAWGEARAKAHLKNPNVECPQILTPMRGLSDADVEVAWRWAQHYAQGYDLSTYSGEEDPAVIAELQAQLAAAQAALTEAQTTAAALQVEIDAQNNTIEELNAKLATVDSLAKQIDQSIPDATP